MSYFALQESSKLISRKIWVIEKSWNFHTEVITYLSATYLMYWAIRSQFMPINAHGKASVRNSISISTASQTIFKTCSVVNLFFKWEYIKQAKSVWRPSSREINSLLNVKPEKRNQLDEIHSVEISWFFYHSDFTSNQIWGFQ